MKQLIKLKQRLRALIMIVFFLASVSYINTVNANVTIKTGSKITVNDSTIDLNCGDLAINTGGVLNVGSGTVTNVRSTTIEPLGTLIDDSGGIDSCNGEVLIESSSVVVSDAGDGTYTISLSTPPEGTVGISVTADVSCCIVTPATVTLTDTSPQTITVQAAVGLPADDITRCEITHKVTGSTSSFYQVDMVPESTQVTLFGTNTGFVITQTDGTTTAVEGEPKSQTFNDSYTIAPRIAPSGPVEVQFFSDSGQCQAYREFSDILTFTDTTPQTVYVYGINDGVYEGGDHTSRITHSVVATEDPEQFPLSTPIDAVEVTISDAGIVITETGGGTSVIKSGEPDTYSVRLFKKPTNSVTVTMEILERFGDNNMPTDKVVISPSQLTFNNDASALTNQTVTVSPNADFVSRGEYSLIIRHSAPGYVEQTVDVFFGENSALYASVTGIITQTASGTVVSEEGATESSYQYQLSKSADLDVSLSTDGQCLVKSEGQASFEATAGLSFTSENWNIPQTVFVKAIDDDITEESNHTGTITHSYMSCEGSVTSDCSETLEVTVSDNDQIGYTVSPVSGNVSESGNTATFSVKLNSRPTGKVVVDLESLDTGEGTVSPNELIFEPGEFIEPDNPLLSIPDNLILINRWNLEHLVTVTGVNDDIIDGLQSFNIRLITRTTSDEETESTTDTTGYADMMPPSIAVLNADNDFGIITNLFSGEASEEGDARTFGVKLSTVPSESVTVTPTSSDTSEGVTSPSEMVFTSENWNDWQFVTVTGVDDLIDDGNISFAVQLTTTSGSAAYNALAIPDLTVNNYDSVPALDSNLEPFHFSYVIDRINYREENGFTVFIVNKGAENLTKVTVKGADGGSTIIDSLSGDGSKEDPYSFKWTPTSTWTEHLADTPDALDETYKIDFKLFTANGDAEPVQIASAVWVDYPENKSIAANASESLKKTEAQYDVDVLFETSTNIGFDPGTTTAAKFMAMDRDGIIQIFNITLPQIPVNLLYIDSSDGQAGGNLNYDPETDYYSIDETATDYRQLEAEDKLLLRATYYSIDNALSEGALNLSMIVHEGPNKDSVVRYNPVKKPYGAGRVDGAPSIHFEMPGDLLMEQVKFLISETGDGYQSYIDGGTAESEPLLGIFQIRTSHLSTFSLKSHNGGSNLNCFISTSEK